MPFLIETITITYLLCATVQFGFCLLYGRLLFFKGNRETPPTHPISIIIAARNEAENLPALLSALLKQEYKAPFEIVVVSDRSTDGTGAILNGFENEHPERVRSVIIEVLPSGIAPKKNAIAQGIAAAKYDLLLFTDADCLPKSKNWIKEMVQTFSEEVEIVLGYGPYQKKGGWLNDLICYETLLTGVQYLSMALWGNSYMAVGRNFAYKKSLFELANGFENHQKVLSGDDDLFVNQQATKGNVGIVISEAGQVQSIPETTWRNWWRQKRRHHLAGTHYKLGDQLWLGGWWISKIGFYLMFTLLLSVNAQSALYGYVFYLFTFMSIFFLLNKKLSEKVPMLRLPILDVFLVLYMIASAFAYLFKPITSWK